MDAKRYALRWRHHQSTVVAEVGYLYRDAALVDVTLACEDQRTYQAHKLVLSACSHYFQTLFSRHPAHHHPIIFLKDVCGDECEALLTYMYRGEVSVNQEQIHRILKVASSLQVRGLAEVETQNSRNSSPTGMERSSHGLSPSPTPSTAAAHPTKSTTPLSEPTSPNGPTINNSQTPTNNPPSHLLSQQLHLNNPSSESSNNSSSAGGSIRHLPPSGPLVPPNPHSSPAINQDISPYHLFPHHRPPYDPISLFGPIAAEHERKRAEEKISPQSVISPFHPSVRVKQDLVPSNWDGRGVDGEGVSPLSLPDGVRPPFIPPTILSLIGQDQHLPTVPQGFGRIFSISDPIRRVDRLCGSTAGDPRIHKCQFCSRKFKRKDHLKTHIRIHTGERPYKCKICGRGFIQSQQVKIHMKVHLREDTAGGVSSSIFGGNVPGDSRSLSVLYPDLNPSSFGSERDFRSSRSGKRPGSGGSPTQECGPMESDNEESLDPNENVEVEPQTTQRNKDLTRHNSPPPLIPTSSALLSPTLMTATSKTCSAFDSLAVRGGPPSSSSSSVSKPNMHNTTNNNNNNNNNNNPATKCSGGVIALNNSRSSRTTPSPKHHQPMDTTGASPPDELCALNLLKERRSPSPYHISANLKK